MKSVSSAGRFTWATLALSLAILTALALVIAGGGGAAIPKKTLVVVLAAVPTVIDPSVGQGRATTDTLPMWGSPLLRGKAAPPGADKVASPSGVVPYLAKSFKRNADGSYNFVIRKTTSAAGNQASAQDVKYSFNRMIATDFIARFLMTVGNIDPKNPVTVINNRTARINVTSPGALILGALTYVNMGIYDSKEMLKNATEADPWSKKWASTHVATFGAYQAKAFAPGQTILLTRTPNHWTKPFFTKVVVRAIADSGTRLQLMITGNANVTALLDWNQFDSATGEESLDARPGVDTNMDMMFVNLAFKPFSDPRVRRAISMGINRTAIVKAVYKGYAKPALHQVPSSLPLPKNAPKPISYDPNGAKALLAQAGFPDGFTFSLITNHAQVGGYVDQLGALLQSQLAGIGVTVQLNPIASSGEFWAKRVGGQYEALLSAGRPAVADVGYFQFLNNATTGLANWTNYSNPKLDNLVRAMLKTAPSKRLKRNQASALRIVTADTPLIPIAETPIQFVYSKGITGFASYPFTVIYPDVLDRG